MRPRGRSVRGGISRGGRAGRPTRLQFETSTPEVSRPSPSVSPVTTGNDVLPTSSSQAYDGPLGHGSPTTPVTPTSVGQESPTAHPPPGSRDPTDMNRMWIYPRRDLFEYVFLFYFNYYVFFLYTLF